MVPRDTPVTRSVSILIPILVADRPVSGVSWQHMTPALFALPAQDELARRLLRPLTRAGVAFVHWRTERDPHDMQSYIVELALEDAAHQQVGSPALRSGFLLLYAISDALGADGGCFCLDVASGRYRKTAAMPEHLDAGAQDVGSENEDDAGDLAADLAS